MHLLQVVSLLQGLDVLFLVILVRFKQLLLLELLTTKERDEREDQVSSWNWKEELLEEGFYSLIILRDERR